MISGKDVNGLLIERLLDTSVSVFVRAAYRFGVGSTRNLTSYSSALSFARS